MHEQAGAAHDHGPEDHEHGREDHEHGREAHDHGREAHDHGREDHEHGREAAALVARARAAGQGWAGTAPGQRAARLAAVRRAVLGAAEEICATVQAETGRPAGAVMMAEVVHAAAHADYCARAAGRVLRTRRVSARPLFHKSAWLAYRPLGVAAVIAPGNYPFLLPFLATASALAAGCSVVVKPSELAPRSGRLVAAVAAAAGLDGLVQVADGGPELAAALVRAGVDVVAVTGSTETGRRISALAAEELVPVLSELGGKDPLLVLADADLRRAARAAVFGAFFNAGQSCVSIERAYVVAAAYPAFLAELDRAVTAVHAGGDGPHGRRGDIGPVLGGRQLAVLRRHLADATARGATIRAGGRERELAGRTYLEPTVLTGVDHTMAVMRAESFGPVLPVMRVADEDEAVALANDSPYGLHASVWTRDTRHGRRVAARLRCGAVAINDVQVNYAMPGLPFGGVGWSGNGRQGGPHGLRGYCYTQTVTAGWLDLPRDPQWYPQIGGARLWGRVARLLYGR